MFGLFVFYIMNNFLQSNLFDTLIYPLLCGIILLLIQNFIDFNKKNFKRRTSTLHKT